MWESSTLFPTGSGQVCGGLRSSRTASSPCCPGGAYPQARRPVCGWIPLRRLTPRRWSCGWSAGRSWVCSRWAVAEVTRRRDSLAAEHQGRGRPGETIDFECALEQRVPGCPTRSVRLVVGINRPRVFGQPLRRTAAFAPTGSGAGGPAQPACARPNAGRAPRGLRIFLARVFGFSVLFRLTPWTNRKRPICGQLRRLHAADSTHWPSALPAQIWAR
jgi:hypothetical protein